MPKYETYEVRLANLIVNGYVIEKIVRKLGKSGVIFVPKGFIGRKFRVILLPEENILQI